MGKKQLLRLNYFCRNYRKMALAIKDYNLGRNQMLMWEDISTQYWEEWELWVPHISNKMWWRAGAKS